MTKKTAPQTPAAAPHGSGGSYTIDPATGERVLIERTLESASAGSPAPSPPAPLPLAGEGSTDTETKKG